MCVPCIFLGINPRVNLHHVCLFNHATVTIVISSTDDENYDDLLDCARKLTGEISEGGVQPGVKSCVKPCVKPCVEPGPSNMPISKTADSGLFLSNGMASSLSHSDQSIDVSFIIFNGL